MKNENRYYAGAQKHNCYIPNEIEREILTLVDTVDAFIQKHLDKASKAFQKKLPVTSVKFHTTLKADKEQAYVVIDFPTKDETGFPYLSVIIFSDKTHSFFYYDTFSYAPYSLDFSVYSREIQGYAHKLVQFLELGVFDDCLYDLSMAGLFNRQITDDIRHKRELITQNFRS